MHGKVLLPSSFDSLIPLLAQRGYTVVAPTVREGTIVLDRVSSSEELPIGWHDSHEPGMYRAAPSADHTYFGYTLGPRTAKHYLFPPQQTMLTIEHAETGLRFAPEPPPTERYAFVGLRACELAAVAVQDTVFVDSPFTDSAYLERRRHSFTVGINCAVAGGTCFCTSMGTGPRCSSGYDLVVTEIDDENGHRFIVEVGTEDGAEVLAALNGTDMTAADTELVEGIVARTEASISRDVPATEAYDALVSNLEHPIWDEIANRCLSCTNCTLVCPTCFCSTTEDATDLEGTAIRGRRWDSCFNSEFSYLHGHPVRSSTRSRYRQWMTHKLAYWHDQFDSSGCVGCGRCITWCPAHIDFAEELARLVADSEVLT
ncbi:MAG: 4Fe-4S dicluster domain-containing protein [Acidimicrobiia bacterium]